MPTRKDLKSGGSRASWLAGVQGPWRGSRMDGWSLTCQERKQNTDESQPHDLGAPGS